MSVKLTVKYLNNWEQMIIDYKLENLNLNEDEYQWILRYDSKFFVKAIEHLHRFGKNVSEELFINAKKIPNVSSQARLYLNEIESKKFISKIFSNNPSPYDPNYIAKRDNISIEEATIKVAKYKKNKATSKEGFVRRHGEEKGLELFEKFQGTSDSSSVDHYVEKYGKEEGTKLYNKESFEHSKRCIAYWVKHGHTEEEAIKLVSNFQLESAGVHREYYVKRGYSKAETDYILANIKKDKIVPLQQMSYDYLMNTLSFDIISANKILRFIKNSSGFFDKNILEEYYASNNKFEFLMEKLEDLDEILDDYDTAEKQNYYRLAKFYTKLNDLSKLPNYELRGKGKGTYNLDHKYSIMMGFYNNVHPQVIGSLYNLEYIPIEINSSKQAKCSITLEKLMEDFKNDNQDSIIN